MNHYFYGARRFALPTNKHTNKKSYRRNFIIVTSFLTTTIIPNLMLYTGLRRIAFGRRLVGKRRHVDVAVLFFVFPTVLPLLLPSAFWP